MRLVLPYPPSAPILNSQRGREQLVVLRFASLSRLLEAALAGQRSAAQQGMPN